MLANQLQPLWQRHRPLPAPPPDEIVGGPQVEVGEPGDPGGHEPGPHCPPADGRGRGGEHGGSEPSPHMSIITVR